MMTFKEWSAVIGLSMQTLVGAWVVNDLLHNPIVAGSVATVAAKLLWAGGIMIALIIGLIIATAIAIGMVRRRGFVDDRADERDKAVTARSKSLAYYISSVGGLLTLIVLAMGYDPAIAAYTLFGVGMVAGAAESVAQLVYYRFG